jgi:hydrogenase/urease accessory protein HupE
VRPHLLVQAHLVTTGLGPVYDGIGHLLLTPEDLLPVVALGLLLGLRGAEHARPALLALPLGWLTGAIGGAVVGWGGPSTPLAAASFLVLGGLVAADAPIPRVATIGLASGAGLLHGLINGASLAEARIGAVGLLCIVGAAFVILTPISAFVSRLDRPWSRIAVRVLGSWVAASGLLLVGWSLRAVRAQVGFRSFRRSGS